ncbi:hypothetical protein [Streptomyces sp. NPDC051567]|uniref:hypothetical protein n=1 Tax=Streptomyces sp. NPDC051567 TaxID=3365660 RepID=UPI0037897E76
MSCEPGSTVEGEKDEAPTSFPPIPRPARGCDVCGALFAQWLRLRDPRSDAYDRAEAAAVEREIQLHPHAGE